MIGWLEKLVVEMVVLVTPAATKKVFVNIIRKGQPTHSLLTEKLHAFAYRRQHAHIPLWRADKAAKAADIGPPTRGTDAC